VQAPPAVPRPAVWVQAIQEASMEACPLYNTFVPMHPGK
jgi:hypothetical protein